MRISLGIEISRAAKALSTIPEAGRSIWRTIFEPFAGAWQMNKEEKVGTLYCYPTLYACFSRLEQDFGKLPFVLKRLDSNGIWQTEENNPAYAVLRKPNGYQTAQQFRASWILSKLSNGNTYVLKRRDDRGVVNAMYVLDPCRVMPLVSDTGDVFYQLNYTVAENLLPRDYPAQQIIVPARDIIHDRMNTFHHPLVGVPPLSAAYWPAVKNLKILRSSAEFFGNKARPGGILTAPAGMNEDDAARVKTFWDENYTGQNAGKVAVIGADMKYVSFAENAVDSQLAEQMKYSDEQICQAFGIPPFKIGIGSIPAGLDVGSINLLYFDGALSAHIESCEDLLDEALSLSRDLGIWMDTEPLLRMDAGKQAEFETKLVGGKVKTPDEARRRFNLAPTGGGDTLWGQHQDYPLGMLAERRDLNPAEPAAPAIPTAPTPPDPSADDTNKAVIALWKRSPESFVNGP